MDDNKKKKWIVVAGGIIVMGLMIVLIVINKDEKKISPETENTAIPTIDPNKFYGGAGPNQKEAEELWQEHKQAIQEYPLWNKMPYEGRGYKISHYSAPLTIAVYLKGLDKEIVEKEVKDWVLRNGGDPYAHTIEWR